MVRREFAKAASFVVDAEFKVVTRALLDEIVDEIFHRLGPLTPRIGTRCKGPCSGTLTALARAAQEEATGTLAVPRLPRALLIVSSDGPAPNSRQWSANFPSPQLRKILDPELRRRAFIRPRQFILASAQFDAADFARNRLGQIAEFEPAHAFERREALAQMLEDRQRCLAVGRMALRERRHKPWGL